MVVCRKRRDEAVESIRQGRRNGSAAFQGGPVFLPRRKPSALAETLMVNLARELEDGAKAAEDATG